MQRAHDAVRTSHIRITAVTIALLGVAPLRATIAQSGADSSAKHFADRLTYATTAGSMQFPSGFTERGISAVLRVQLARGLALGVTPAFARLDNPASLGGGGASGLLDTPVELTYDRALPFAHAPVVGIGLAASLPTGDTASGFGSGAVGYSIEGGVGYSPSDRVWLHAGAGKPLSDFSSMGALGGTGTTWADLSVGWSANDRLSLDAGFDGDIAGADSAVGPARAIGVGASWTLRAPVALDMHLLHGVSGPAARWSFTIGFGTDFAYLASLGSSSPTQNAAAGVGGQSHGKGWGSGTTKTTGAGKGHGHGPP